MARFGSSGGHGFGGDDNKEMIVGKVEDIKSAPQYGERRIIVREKTGSRSTLAVDMPTGCSADLKCKETYCFSVEEKESTRGGGMGTRMKSSSFKSYHCEDTPEKYSAGAGQSSMFGRFGNDERGGGSRRNRTFTG